MTESEYQSKLQWVKEHMDITKDDPLFVLFCRTVEEIENFEEANSNMTDYPI